MAALTQNYPGTVSRALVPARIRSLEMFCGASPETSVALIQEVRNILFDNDYFYALNSCESESSLLRLMKPLPLILRDALQATGALPPSGVDIDY